MLLVNCVDHLLASEGQGSGDQGTTYCVALPLLPVPVQLAKGT